MRQRVDRRGEQIGKPGLVATLANDRRGHERGIAGNPANGLLVSRLVGDMRFLIATSLDADFLVTQMTSLQTATDNVAQSTAATRATALAALDASLCGLGDALNLANTFGTNVVLSPASQVPGPHIPATFTVNLQNTSNHLNVIDLSVSGVPAGITATFNQPSVSLGPFGSTFNFSNAVTLTLTPGDSLAEPFTFEVVATPRGAPAYARRATGSLRVRPEQINLDQVTATPAFVNAGTPVTISARVFSAVNQATQSNYLHADGPQRRQPVRRVRSRFFNTTTASTLQTLTFDPI